MFRVGLRVKEVKVYIHAMPELRTSSEGIIATDDVGRTLALGVWKSIYDFLKHVIRKRTIDSVKVFSNTYC